MLANDKLCVHVRHAALPAENSVETRCRVLTKLVRKPEVIREEVGHVVVQPLQHVQGIIDEEDCVIISIQHPLEVVIAMKMGSQKWSHSGPKCQQHNF